jgi:hypothetical protein
MNAFGKSELIAILFVMISSCYPEEPPAPDTYAPTVDSIYSFAGQRWLLYQYRVGEAPLNYPLTDTLDFNTATQYQFNRAPSTYSLYEIPNAFKLNLNGTPWGNIGGTVYPYNITQGDIQGLRFTEMTTGSGAYYYLWLYRIQ